MYMRAKENVSEKKAEFKRNLCTNEDALGRFRKRNITIRMGIYVYCLLNTLKRPANLF